MLPSYIYIPSEENPDDAPFRNVVARKLSKRGARPILTTAPSRKVKYKGKRPPSNQQLGRAWWRRTDYPVADLVNRCQGEEKARSQTMFDAIDSGTLDLGLPHGCDE